MKFFGTFSNVLCVVLPSFAAADTHADNRAFSTDGHSYQMACNTNGFVLTSDYPVARFIENGVLSEIEEGIETLYLGKSCDAFTQVYGNGTWGLANGGFAVSFDDYRIGFPRQAPFCEPDAAPDVTFAFDCPL